MLAAVRAKGFETPTAIQKLTIPHLLTKPNDIIAQSQTGTGKTAAYGLPILQTLEPARGPIQAIILVPTRELALQAAEELLSYNREKRLSITAIYGGAAMSEQLRRLAKGIDIVVGTPGRVLDHIRRGTMKLENVRYLVLDEADEMLNMGFVEDVEEIMSHTSDERRVLLFSATMPERIIRLSKTYMRDTEIVRVEHKQITADLTEQIYFEVREADKFDALTRIIDVEPEFYGIIFARTKIGADETASRLTARGYAAEVLHGDVSQAQREKILRKFRDRTINILVATDVAARGIDVGNLTHVINYSLPQDSESYVHRIGRTGRAGKQGTAITFVSPSEFRGLNNLMRDIKVEIKRETLPSPQDIVEMKRLKIKEEMQEIVENESYEVTDVFVAVGAHSENGRSLGERIFPIVFVIDALAPVGCRAALEQRQERLAAHLRRFGESAGGHDRGGDVDVLHHLLHRAARRNEFGTVGQHRHAYGGFVEVAFVDQSVFAPREAVVAHIDHQSRFVQPFGLQKIQQPPDGVVHAGHRLAVIAEVLLVRQCAVILVIDAVPAFPLVLYPVGEPALAVPAPSCERPAVRILAGQSGDSVLRHVERRRIDRFFVLVHPFAGGRRLKPGVYRFVGEVDEERTLFVVAYEVDGVVGQYVGGVKFRIELYALAVDVQYRVVVGPLSAESLPMVESGLGHVVLIAHVPFAEEGGAVSVLLEVLREKDQIVGLRCLIVHDGMGVRKQTGEDGGPLPYADSVEH